MAINVYHDGAPDWPHPLGVIQLTGQLPFWRTASGITRVLAYVLGQHSLSAFYATEALPTPQSGFIFDGDAIAAKIQPVHDLAAFAKLRRLAVDAFRRAGYPVVARRHAPVLWHEAGTVCVGTDPKQSVIDPDCQVHGVRDLYVVDQSSLPSAGCVNTALTIIALALRAGDHIAQKRTPDAASLATGPGDAAVDAP